MPKLRRIARSRTESAMNDAITDFKSSEFWTGSKYSNIVLFQSGEASTVEGNKHTHTHTHTHTKQAYYRAINWNNALQYSCLLIHLKSNVVTEMVLGISK